MDLNNFHSQVKLLRIVKIVEIYATKVNLNLDQYFYRLDEYLK
ncbi:hypothetical protein L289_3730 [Acinetobacter gerneri DSM 14967 = CIP 107464 = MTCC 9824]|nr:hypothetical protein L289_3730 [Acinetobacter gerneri DSM 14967 = CIP 107464 = MTCC 9824]